MANHQGGESNQSGNLDRSGAVYAPSVVHDDDDDDETGTPGTSKSPRDSQRSNRESEKSQRGEFDDVVEDESDLDSEEDDDPVGNGGRDSPRGTSI